jgi:hypothetical protein
MVDEKATSERQHQMHRLPPEPKCPRCSDRDGPKIRFEIEPSPAAFACEI